MSHVLYVLFEAAPLKDSIVANLAIWVSGCGGYRAYELME